ncbi:MAG TPA: dihydrofolate reductase family protein [Dehalococcoidia bacterium]|nr:dihydrofolate reductase family protein [Dehalococcoidia bacterium]
MGKIVVSEFVSLDGIMEAPGGEPGYKHTGWVFGYQSDDQVAYKLAEVLSHEAMLIGRTTYESFAGAWPERSGEFADRMNSMPKFVASTTLKVPAWSNTTVFDGDAMAAVARLKQELDGDLLVAGSRSLVDSLRQHDLVDVYRLMVFPIVLGSGKRLFDDAEDATRLQLIETQALTNGAIVLTYRTLQREGAKA